MFTTADTYVVHIDPRLDGDLRLLVIAAAAAVDTALKQDPRGLDISDVGDISGSADTARRFPPEALGVDPAAACQRAHRGLMIRALATT